MLLTLATLAEIRAGNVDLAFRLWRKPTVKSGGRLRTALGELAIGAVDVIDPAAILDADARRAGYPSADDLRADLFRVRKGVQRARTARPTEESVVYRVEVRWFGEDARADLRNTLAGSDELEAILKRLAAMDARSSRGTWTHRTLALIAQFPERRAPELAELEGLDTPLFKADVRKLKELGLTESLRIGYRVSARGNQVLAALR